MAATLPFLGHFLYQGGNDAGENRLDPGNPDAFGLGAVAGEPPASDGTSVKPADFMESVAAASVAAGLSMFDPGFMSYDTVI